jgi:flagellar biosynthesis protein FlhF
MQVKVFEAENMSSALKKVRKALGPDALILSTRTVRKKGLGLLGKPITEITAAIDSPTVSVNTTNTSNSRRRTLLGKMPDQSQDITYDEIWHRDRDNGVDPLTHELQELKGNLKRSNLLDIREEIDQIKGLIQGFSQEMLDLNKAISVTQHTAGNSIVSASGAWLAPVAAELSHRGIDTEAAAAILKLAAQELTPQQIASSELLSVFFEETISSLFQVKGSFLPVGSNQKRIALIGPTGVGKTTTIAKLAAAYLKTCGRDLTLVTIDTYRIAAVEQLKVYGEIMNLEVDVVMAPEHLEEVLDRHRNKKLILIDTAGRSPKDERSIEELSSFLRPELNIENHLVLAATARNQELHSAVKRFGRLDLTSFIFTKLDECENFGALLNVHTKNDYPLSYLTDGQRVPEDLLLADPQKIAGLIMGKPYHIRSSNAGNA